MQALRKTIEATKLSNPELSIKLGHSRKYLTNLLNKGCSTAMQNQLIEEINQVMAGTFKTDAEVIAELTQRLSEEQDKYTELNNRAIGDMLDKNTEIEELKSMLDKVDSVNDGLRSELQQLGKEFHYARSELSKVDAKNDELTEQLNIKNHGEITMNQTIHKLRQSQKIHRLLSLVCLATIILLIVTQWGV